MASWCCCECTQRDASKKHWMNSLKHWGQIISAQIKCSVKAYMRVYRMIKNEKKDDKVARRQGTNRDTKTIVVNNEYGSLF